MALTYIQIASRIITSTTGDVVFSNIPQTYTDLLLKITARGSAGNVWGYLAYRINNDTANHTDVRRIYLPSNTTGEQTGTTSGAFIYAYMSGDQVLSNSFCNIEAYIPNYTVSGRQKSIFTVSSSPSNTTASASTGFSVGNYSGSSGISQISITPNGSFLSGSSIFLYGIKNS